MEQEKSQRDMYNRIAGIYDVTIGVGALLRGFSDTGERRKMVALLNLKPGYRVLEVSVGTGTNLPLLAQGAGPEGTLVGLDISPGMLTRCRRKLRRWRLAADLVEGEAAHLTFADGAFDAVLHFGGINAFGARKAAIEEMVRVARPDAKIVISDEGLPPDRKVSFRTRLVARSSSLYSSRPPVDLLPPQAKDVHVTWFRGDACYLIDFVNT